MQNKDRTKEEKRLATLLGGMKGRCYRTSHKWFHNYGGRGITICEEWLNSTDSFIEWAKSNGAKPGLEIDRIDNDTGYCPENCRFITRQAQFSNKRGQYKVDIWGDVLLLKEAVMKYSVAPLGMVRRRLREGWTDIEAVILPPIKGHCKHIEGWPKSKARNNVDIFGKSYTTSSAVRLFSRAPKGSVESRINQGWHPLNAILLPTMGHKIIAKLKREGWNPSLNPLEATGE